MVKIKDIAHGLAGRMRYGCQTWLSVAQHSIVVLGIVERMIKLKPMECRFVFFHDGSEYVLPDMPAPIKEDPRMAWFREVEDHVQGCIYTAMDVDPNVVSDDVKNALKIADRMVRGTEKRFFGSIHPDWRDPVETPEQMKPMLLQGYLHEWAPKDAKRKFLDVASRLGVKV